MNRSPVDANRLSGSVARVALIGAKLGVFAVFQLAHVPHAGIHEGVELLQGIARAASAGFAFAPVQPTAGLEPKAQAIEQKEGEADQREIASKINHGLKVRPGVASSSLDPGLVSSFSHIQPINSRNKERTDAACP